MFYGKNGTQITQMKQIYTDDKEINPHLQYKKLYLVYSYKISSLSILNKNLRKSV